MGKRCVVSGCTSINEQKQFFLEISKNGNALCPVHRINSNECQCTASTSLFSYYNFPTKPSLRGLWYKLLKLSSDFSPKCNDTVCSKHFDVTSRQRKKVPVLNIGRSETEVDIILENYVSDVMASQKAIRQKNGGKKAKKGRSFTRKSISTVAIPGLTPKTDGAVATAIVIGGNVAKIPFDNSDGKLMESGMFSVVFIS